MAELKLALKEAKNAIKDKDYESAMIYCKEALKLDKKNYQALAMFGKVCQEEKRYTDSKNSLLLATQIDSANPLAWQGLFSLYEKNALIFDKNEAISLLTHLKEITIDEEKLHVIIKKLANAHHIHDSPDKAVFELELYLSTLNSIEKKVEIRKIIIQYLESIANPSDDLTNKLIENYSEILNDSSLGENENNYKTYLRLIYKIKNYEKLIDAAQFMYSVFPTAYPLEWIARAYTEHFGLNNEFCLLPSDIVNEFIKKLLSLNETSSWGNVAQGLIHYQNNEFQSAQIYLRRGSELLENNILAWLTLLESQTNINDYGGMVATCTKILNLMDSNSNTIVLPSRFNNREELKRFVLLKQADTLLHIGHVNHLQQCAVILEQLPEKDLETNIMHIKALIKLNKLNDAVSLLESIKEHYNDASLKPIMADVAKATGDIVQAKKIYEEILEENPSSAELLFELGRFYFEMKDYENSVVYLLKAAKADPRFHSPFLFLGHYYRTTGNLDRAKKCYEKSFYLKSCDEECGAALSDIYRVTEDNESNLALLIRITSETGRGGSGWAWLRLGLHYLAEKNYVEAVQALQYAIQIKPTDRICWECLGDAYLSRGSYTAALKVFKKAVDLDSEGSVYSRCKIAHLNHIIGEYLLSISEYESVLDKELENSVKTVALVGLAEVLLARAKKYRDQNFFSNLKDDCLYAIRCLSRAACQYGNTITVWKLIGDACTMMTCIPPSLSPFKVPARLLDTSVSDIETGIEINQEELLSLGARCYGVGVHISQEDASLWHDLGVNLYMQTWVKMKVSTGINYSLSDVDDAENETLEKSLVAIKKSLSLDSSSYNAWNSLGVIAFFKKDLQLAHHSFIQSLLIYPTVDAWTHLGTLYFIQSDIYLAHEAFSQAQALDPEFIACWVGQAIVANSVKHYEAFDLYRHTTSLGINPESCLGFANSVLEKICQPPFDDNALINDYSQLNRVSDSLIFYTREKELDMIGLNMCGLVLEMAGLKYSAIQIYEKAVQSFENQTEVLPIELRDSILLNYGRILCSLNKLEEATKCYNQLEKQNFYSSCGLALTHLKGDRYEEAYQKYTESLVWLSPDDNKKSEVLVALAFLQYKFKNIEQVKTLLFQSASVQGLLALTSLGLLQEDETLTKAALEELKPYYNSKKYVHHIAFLKATYAVLSGDYRKAKSIVCKAVHCHPSNPSLWRFLSQHLLTASDALSGRARLQAPIEAASATITLAQSSGNNWEVAQDVILKVIACLKAAKSVSETEEDVTRKKWKKRALNEAQRAVLMYPAKMEPWAVLISVMDNTTKSSKLCKLWTNKSDSNSNLNKWFQFKSQLCS